MFELSGSAGTPERAPRRCPTPAPSHPHRPAAELGRSAATNTEPIETVSDTPLSRVRSWPDAALGAPAVSRGRRYAVAALAVAAWMALGWLTRAGANQYLLLGVPLAVAFQRGVARRPLRALWVREAPPFRADPRTVALALAFAAAPVAALVRQVSGPRHDLAPDRVAWLLCAAAGAAAAAYAVRHARGATLRALLACLATAGTVGVALVGAAWLARGADALPPAAGGMALRWLLLYWPVTFVLEEVFFRGALDAYVHRPGEPGGWGAAVFVSALWGLWHLPVVAAPGLATAAGLLAVHTAIGVPLSRYWRRGGNLAAPAAAHAAVDAVRNALLG